MQTTKLVIAGYTRISVDTELEKENTSIENQKVIIKEYVKKYFPNAELDFYEDRDKSGYTFDEREDYQRLRPLLFGGYYNILIVKDFSRFARRNSKGLVELEEIRDHDVRIISIGDSVDYPTHDDWNNIQIRFLLNEIPVTDTSKKIKRVIDTRQNNARWICSVPYGYYITDSKNMIYSIDEPAAEVVRKIFDLYISGWGYKKIANYLTEEHIPTPRTNEKTRKESLGKTTKIKSGDVWSIATVKEIIENDFYIGTLRQHKYTRKKINGIDKKVDKENQIVFEKYHPPIVDTKTFSVAQEQLLQRTRSNYRGNKKYDTTYSGFLFCGDCGSPMFSRSRPDLPPSYICGTYHKRGLKGCTSHHTRTDMLDIMIKEYIKLVMNNSADMLAELEKSIREEPAALKSAKSAIDKLNMDYNTAREELKTTKKQKIRELAKHTGNEDLIEETYAEIEKELTDRIIGIEKQIALISQRHNQVVQINRFSATIIDIFKEIVEKNKLDPRDLSLILNKIIVYQDHIDIELKSDIETLLHCNIPSSAPYTPNENTISINTETNINISSGSKSPVPAKVVLQNKHQQDKSYSVNVIQKGDPPYISLLQQEDFIYAIINLYNRLSKLTIS